VIIGEWGARGAKYDVEIKLLVVVKTHNAGVSHSATAEQLEQGLQGRKAEVLSMLGAVEPIARDAVLSRPLDDRKMQHLLATCTQPPGN
jgi:hypothetical protein